MLSTPQQQSSKSKSKATLSDDEEDLFSSSSHSNTTTNKNSEPKATPSSSDSSKIAKPQAKPQAVTSDNNTDLFSDPLGGALTPPQASVAPSKTTPTAAKTATADEVKTKPLALSKAKNRDPLFGSSPDEGRSDGDDPFSGSKPPVAAKSAKPSSTISKETNSTQRLSPRPATTKSSRKAGGGLFEESDDEDDLFSEPKSSASSQLEPSDADPAPQKEVSPAVSTRRKPVGAVSLFGGVDPFGGGEGGEKKSNLNKKSSSSIAQKQEDLFCMLDCVQITPF